MISRRDVIRVRIPFPTINSALASNSHMYICHKANSDAIRLIKCQTLKPYMLGSDLFKHYVDENPDPSRNPFKHVTRIDCDKEFEVFNLDFDESLKTTIRPNISKDLMTRVEEELDHSELQIIHIDQDQMRILNRMVTIR